MTGESFQTLRRGRPRSMMDDRDVDVKSFSSQRWTSLCPPTGRRSAMGRVGLHVGTQILSPHDGVLGIMQQTFVLVGENSVMLGVRPLTQGD